MARRGRPRKPAPTLRATTRAGRETIVLPTPELLAQRRRIAGDASIAIDFPLDVLAAWHRRDAAAGVPAGACRGIGAEQWRAGWRFARLAWRAFRPPVPLPPLFWSTRIDSGPAPTPRDDAAMAEEAVRIRAAWRAARAALATAGPAALRAVDAVVVSLVAPADAATVRALRHGLAALDRHFHEARRDGAAGADASLRERA